MIPAYFFFAKPLWTAGSVAALAITFGALVAIIRRRRSADYE
jgi:hypothetical protein